MAAQPIRQMWPSVGVRSSVGMRPLVWMRIYLAMCVACTAVLRFTALRRVVHCVIVDALLNGTT